MNDPSKKAPPPPLGAPTPDDRSSGASFEELQRHKDKGVGLAAHLAVTQPGYPGPFSAKNPAAPSSAPKDAPVFKTGGTHAPAPPPLPRAPLTRVPTPPPSIPPVARVATPVPATSTAAPRVPPPPLKPTQLSLGSITTLPGAESPFAPTLDDVPHTPRTLPSQSLPGALGTAETPDETLDDSAEVNVPVENAQILATPATLARRLAALALDAAVVGGGALLFLFVAATLTKAKSPPSHFGLLDAWLFRLSAWHGLVVVTLFLLAVLCLAYTTFGAFLFGGRTVGRKLTGLHLVDKRGTALTPVHAVTRATFALVSMGLFFSGFWLALFDRRGQTLHDKLASTFVVRLQA